MRLASRDHEVFTILFLDLCAAPIYVESPAGIAEIA